MNKQMKFVAAALCAASSLFADDPGLVSGFKVSQDPDTRVVTADFTLSEQAIVLVDVRTNGVTIGAENFSKMFDALTDSLVFPGNKVVKAGSHKFVWKPTKEWPGYQFANELTVNVRAHRLANPPDYMVIAMKNIPEEGLSKGDRRFYATAEDLPGGLYHPVDLDADTAKLDADPYRTTKMVFRRIPAAGVQWRMGAAPGDTSTARIPHYVTLQNDYYMAIYLTTRLQKYYIYGENDFSNGSNPRVNVPYSTVRGDPTNPDYCWPDKTDVDPNSWAGLFTAFCGLKMDLATEAEWEFACRAGCGDQYYWGSDIDKVAEYEWTSEAGSGNYRRVGLLKPNGFGLYDMTGNLREWVRDQYGTFTTTPVVDPKGPTDNPGYRVVRCGSVWLSAGYAGVAYRASSPAANGSFDGNYYGFRFSCPAVIPAE